MKPGYIRDSNKSTLITLINKEHGFPIFDCGIATDDLEDLKAKITLALNEGDLIVTTGGVSMGDKDLLRQVLVKVRYTGWLIWIRWILKGYCGFVFGIGHFSPHHFYGGKIRTF